jgi:hypothetical protein
MLTDEQVKAIRARWDAAPPGPYRDDIAALIREVAALQGCLMTIAANTRDADPDPAWKIATIHRLAGVVMPPAAPAAPS